MTSIVKTIVFSVSFLMLLLWSFLYLRIREKNGVFKSVLLFMFVFSDFWYFVTSFEIAVNWFILVLLPSIIAGVTLAVSRFVLKINHSRQIDYYAYLAIITASVLVTGYFALVGWALRSMGPLYH